MISTLKASTRCTRSMGDVKCRFDNGSLNLLDAVVLSRDREASDPHDYIHAFLGLFPGREELFDILPDCYASLSKAYIKLTQNIMKEKMERVDAKAGGWGPGAD